MNPDLSLQTLPLDLLCRTCAEQTALYRLRKPNDTRWCLELFRRALDLLDQAAWHCLHSLYVAFIVSWIRRHPSFWGMAAEVDDLAQETFLKFSRIFSSGAPRSSDFVSLAKLLEYLQACTNGQVLDWARRQKRRPAINAELDDEREATYLDREQSDDELWAELRRRCRNERERVVVEARYRLGLAPRDIFREYASLFKDVRDVSLTLARVVARLKGDSDFREFLE